jgi:hypothetical protein
MPIANDFTDCQIETHRNSMYSGTTI